VNRLEKLKAFLLGIDCSKILFTAEMKKLGYSVSPSSLVLDAGSGAAPYRKFYRNCNYHTLDRTTEYTNPTILGCVESIPVADNCYDIVLCTQVLEHVKNPSLVVKELARVLKVGGKLFLTTPGQYGVHTEENYSNFLKQGLELLAEEANLKTNYVKPIGGMPNLLGFLIGHLPIYYLKQSKLNWVFIPFYLMLLAICRLIIAPILVLLDFTDLRKDWTLTYLLVAEK
jgi:SAM-dependent methyltransferase